MSHILEFINILERRIFIVGEDGITALELDGLNCLRIHRGSEIEDNGILHAVYKDSNGKTFHIKPEEQPN